jgi:multiple antibiotic resistance protein
MLRAHRPTEEGLAEVREGMAKEDGALTPLAVPLLAGPAVLTTVATLMRQARGWKPGLTP